ncbi:class I SAM-dependent methyltransferase [Neobacillus sp. Marseille-QA0830]
MDIRSKWNGKYRERLNHNRGQPETNPRLKHLSSYLTGGEALDLACGLGGNSQFLARMNYQVQAVDISEVAIDYIKELVAVHNLTINSRICDLSKLDNISLKKSLYDLVVMTYYLDRSLFSAVKDSIKHYGFIFIETFYMSPQPENQSVSDQYKLKSQELLTVFRDWKVLFFEENEQEGRQTIFCQKTTE